MSAQFEITADRMNVFFKGRFQTIRLSELGDEDLKYLYEAGNPYIKPTPQGYKEIGKTQPINLGKIKPKK